VTTPNEPMPYSPPLEKALLPSPERIVGAVQRVVG
jgi:pyruvate/2-oxoglutarate/acetoin dehydrogenase E1 component